MASSIVKVNKVSGRVLGACIFLSAEEIMPFLTPDTAWLEVTKSSSNEGICLRLSKTDKQTTTRDQ